MTPARLQYFRKLVLDRTGLSLAADKDYLLKTRLDPVARAEGLGDVDTLLARVMTDPTGPLAQKCLDAMATHESYFFRDGAPFEQLRDQVLPRLIAARASTRRLRIWSAACSSGQEPYSLAMLLLEEEARWPGFRFSIVATDISRPILERARAGFYSDFEVRRGLSPERQARWMQKEGEAFRVSPRVRSLIDFRCHNLLDGVSMFGRFDLILCRNVLIYFEHERKRWALDRLASALEPDGALILGSAETVVGLNSPFRPSAGLRAVFEMPEALKKAG